MKFCAENAKDIDKYFRGSYMKFVGMSATLADGSPVPVPAEAVHFVDRVEGDVVKGKFTQEGERVPFLFHLYPSSAAPAPEVEFILPKKSYFNTPHGACLLYRIPARQYRKGVCADNTAIQLLHSAYAFAPQEISFDLLTLYVGKQAFEKFGPHNNSYAVSKRMAVSMTGIIFLDQTRIGSINYDKSLIQVNQQMFVPEINSVLRTHGQDYTVVVKGESVKSKKKISTKYFINEEGDVCLSEEN